MCPNNNFKSCLGIASKQSSAGRHAFPSLWLDSWWTQHIEHIRAGGVNFCLTNRLRFQVGNAVIDSDQDGRGNIDYWWTHALISDETYALLQPCATSTSDYCNSVVNMAYNEQGNIDIYDIYTPACLDLTTSLKKKKPSKV